MRKRFWLWVVALLLVAFHANAGSDKQSEPYRPDVCKKLVEVSDCEKVRSSQAQYGVAPAAAVATVDGVTITTDAGQAVRFKTKLEPGLDPEEAYSFLGFLPRHQYFVVLGVYGYGEISREAFVSKRTGEVYWIQGNTFVSPEGNYIFAIRTPHGAIATRGAVYAVSAEAIVEVAQIDLGNCPPRDESNCPDVSDAVWISPTDIVAFSLEYTKPPKRVLGNYLVRISKTGDRWATTRLPAN